MMRCSVVIPLYNKADFIEAALRSVLDQTHRHLEVIVVDDGSTDDGPRRVRAIADPRVRLLSQENQGVSHARNAGIAAATGDLVFFLDADDWYHCAYLDTVARMAGEHPEHTVFSTAFRHVWDGEMERTFQDVAQAAEPESVTDFFTRWSKGAFFCTNSIAARRTGLLALQPCFPPGESMAEDQDLWFRLIEIYGLLHCSTPLVAYRMNVAASLCALAAGRRGHGLQPAYARLEQRARLGQMPAQHVRPALRLVADKRTSVARSTLAAGNRGAALMQLLRIGRGPLTRRWWLTLLLCLTGGAQWMRQWEAVRRRSMTKRQLLQNHQEAK